MEILHSNAKRTILVTLDDDPAGDVYCSLLAKDFNVVRVDSPSECLQVMTERAADLSAVLIDIEMAKDHDFAFLKTVSSDRRFDTIPVLVASRRPIDETDMPCLDEGAFDFITPPHHPGITKRRIENAVRMKRATTFYEIEAILRRLPSNIFLKDAEGRYVFMTHYWRHIKRSDDPNWTPRGKTDLDLRKDRENAIKAMEADREIVRTGKGTSYVIETNIDGVQDFLKLIKEPVFDEDGNVTGIIALINDVTETELLKRELEQRARTDELTGLGNRRAFEEYLKGLPGDAKYPIALISADCDRLKMVNDTFGHLVGDEYIRMAATMFKVCLPDEAQAFRVGGDEFIAFMPASTLEQAQRVVDDMRKKSKLFSMPQGEISISYGTAVMEQPGDDADAAVARADRAMYEDKAARKRARG